MLNGEAVHISQIRSHQYYLTPRGQPALAEQAHSTVSTFRFPYIASHCIFWFYFWLDLMWLNFIWFDLVRFDLCRTVSYRIVSCRCVVSVIISSYRRTSCKRILHHASYYHGIIYFVLYNFVLFWFYDIHYCVASVDHIISHLLLLFVASYCLVCCFCNISWEYASVSGV